MSFELINDASVYQEMFQHDAEQVKRCADQGDIEQMLFFFGMMRSDYTVIRRIEEDMQLALF